MANRILQDPVVLDDERRQETIETSTSFGDIFFDEDKQHFRKKLRQLASQPAFRIFITSFLTVINDVYGMFSASRSLLSYITVFDNPISNLALAFVPILLVDVGSEFILLVFHDLRLCQRKELNWKIIYAGLVGQILTNITWFSLAVMVVVDAFKAMACPFTSILQCSSSLEPGLVNALIILIVFARNIGTVPSFFSNKGVYPIIAAPQLLFLYDLIHKDPNAILKNFDKANKLEEKPCLPCARNKYWLIGTNFVIITILDIAGLTSISTVFKSDSYVDIHGIAVQQNYLGILFFSPILIIDIISQGLILKWHDLLLLNMEETYKNRRRLYVVRFLQVIVTLVWIIMLGILISRVISLQCHDRCQCISQVSDTLCDTDANCTIPEYNLCKPAVNGSMLTQDSCVGTTGGLCSIGYDLHTESYFAINWTDPNINTTMLDPMLCNVYSMEECYSANPSLVDCILLAIIVFNNTIVAVKMYFRSHIYPITLHSTTLFEAYWISDRKDLIVLAIGRMEYGLDWSPDPEKPEIEDKTTEDGVVPLEGDSALAGEQSRGNVEKENSSGFVELDEKTDL